MEQHALYRFYDDGGQLLYVGITDEPGRRFAQHAAKKVWWRDVRGISIDWYDDREQVKAAERRAIRVERPVHNLQRAQPRPVEEKRCGHCVECEQGEPCILYGPTNLDRDLVICETCGRHDCLYGLGEQYGEWRGWSRAFDHYRRKEDHGLVQG